MLRFDTLLIAVILVFLTAAAEAQPRSGRGFDGSAADTDGDGSISRVEFEQWSNAMFEQLDSNGDGVLGEDEQPRQRGRERFRRGIQGGVLAHASDADQDGTVTTSEWNAFLATLEVDDEGVVSAESLWSTLPRPPHAGGARGGDRGSRFDGERPDPSNARFAHLFDRDGDELVKIADLELIFAELDQDGDGELAGDEIPRRPGHGERGQRSRSRSRGF